MTSSTISPHALTDSGRLHHTAPSAWAQLARATGTKLLPWLLPMKQLRVLGYC